MAAGEKRYCDVVTGTCQPMQRWMFLFLFLGIGILSVSAFFFLGEVEQTLVSAREKGYVPPSSRRPDGGKTEDPPSPQTERRSEGRKKPQRASRHHRPVRPLPDRIPLEGFVDLRINRGGGDGGAFYRRGAACAAEVLASPAKPNGCLRLVYDVSYPGSCAGYRGFFRGLNLKAYRYLSFRVRGDSGREQFSVALSDGKNEELVLAEPYLIGAVEDGWQRVVMPLYAFSAMERRERMSGSLALVFSYEHGEPYRSAIDIKEVMFTR